MLMTVPFLSTQQKSFRQALTPYRSISKYRTPHQRKKARSYTIPLQATLKGLLILQYLEQSLKIAVEHFPYFGSHLSQKATIEAEIQNRLCCVSTFFRKLRNRVFDNHNLRKGTKVTVYKAVCIIILLYGSEAWVTSRCNLNTLESPQF